jgi:hypothetical protein
MVLTAYATIYEASAYKWVHFLLSNTFYRKIKAATFRYMEIAAFCVFIFCSLVAFGRKGTLMRNS